MTHKPRSTARFTAGLCLVAIITLGGPGLALAAPPPLSTAELASVRGGFTVEGITFGFGADVRTYVDGKLALQTNLTWTDKGSVTTQTAGGVGMPIGKAGDTAGLNLTGLKAASGVVLTDASGATAIAQRITAGEIQNLVVNTASNRDIRQDIQLNLTIPDLAKMQSNFAMQQATMRMDRSLADSALSSLSH